MEFKYPWVLALIPIVLGLILFVYRHQREAAFRFSSTQLISGIGQTWKVRFRFVPFILRILVLVLFLIALAQPRLTLEETIYKSEGIDIVLAIDTSGSMAAEDFELLGKRANRLNTVKNVVHDFVKQRSNDQIALLAFAGSAFTVCPLTTDYDWLAQNLDRIELGLIEDGTAIGSAIVSSVSRLKDSQAKSKVLILLTDGVNTAGEISPIQAARIAKKFDIKIYTIGAGTRGRPVPYPSKDFFGRRVYRRVYIDFDEKTLKEVADITNGRYFFATNTQDLKDIYKIIDELEKTEIERIGYFEYEELFNRVLLIALFALFGEIFLSQTLLLKVP